MASDLIGFISRICPFSQIQCRLSVRSASLAVTTFCHPLGSLVFLFPFSLDLLFMSHVNCGGLCSCLASYHPCYM